MDKREIIELGQNASIKPDLNFKVVITGEAGVGKTALAKKILFQTNLTAYTPTLSFELLWNSYCIDGKNLCLQIWDTCGQEVFQALSGSFYRTAACALLVYSIDSASSFDKLDSWLKNIRNYAPEDIQIYLIGNKTDLNNQRQITYEKGEKYKTDNNLDYFIETSVENNNNLKELFDYMIQMIYDAYINVSRIIDKEGSAKSNSTVSVKLRPSAISITNDIQKTKERFSDFNGNESSSCNC